MRYAGDDQQHIEGGGPLAFGRISTPAEFDYQAAAVAAVDGFLKCFAKEPTT